MAGIVVVVGEEVVEVNDVEQGDGDFGEKVDYDDAGPCGKEERRTWRVADSVTVVADVVAVAQGEEVTDVT